MSTEKKTEAELRAAETVESLRKSRRDACHRIAKKSQIAQNTIAQYDSHIINLGAYNGNSSKVKEQVMELISKIVES